MIILKTCSRPRGSGFNHYSTGIDGNQSDDSLSDLGAEYIFMRTAGTWSQQSYIKASNTEAEDLFGAYISLDEDKLAVGVTGEDCLAMGIDGD